MRTTSILLLCILGAAVLSTVLCQHSSGPKGCCFTFYSRRLNKTLIASYYMTDVRCPMSAAVLVTKRRRHICADPTLSWVGGIMKKLDESSF